LNLDRQNQIASILRDDDLISSDKFVVASGNGFQFVKRDFIYRPGHWRGKLVLPPWSQPWQYTLRNLVVGHSDIATSKSDIRKLKLLGPRKIFGTNLWNYKNYAESIPLGLTNYCTDSPLHLIYGNNDHLRKASLEQPINMNFDASIYVNFSVNTNINIRRDVLGVLKRCGNTKYGDFDPTEHGRIDYLKSMRRNNFTICPEGNGVDTHRLWETIYMGGIPILLRNNYLPKVLDQLPVIQLNNWKSILDRRFLESEWHRIQTGSFDLQSIRTSFWLKKFRE
jgi:hypothetical protein